MTSPRGPWLYEPGENEAVLRGTYGFVRIVAGEHKGRVGYYSDDDAGNAIVYFEDPATAAVPRYFLIDFHWLRKTHEAPW